MTDRADRLMNLYCPACGREVVTTYRSKKGAVCPLCRVRLKPLQLPACVARRRIDRAKKERAARNASSEAAKSNSTSTVYPIVSEDVKS